jgi:hypothetical protein
MISDFARGWWARLSEMPGPLRTTPRTVANIVRDDPQAYIVAVGSPDYMTAMESDLIDAISEASHPDRIILISRNGRFARGVLAQHLIPSDARLQKRVGGARTSLHVRVARKVLSELNEWDLSAELLQGHYRRVLASSADIPAFDRTRLTDVQVERFIQAELRRSPYTSCTRALRALRDGGQACEQSRFKAFFHRARKVSRAS